VSDVNLQLVREFFELNLFHVLTHWQHESARPRAVEPGLQLLVENTQAPAGASEPGFVLSPEEVPALRRAVVEVRAWHADRFYPSVIESSPVLAQFATDDALGFARQLFGPTAFTTVLVISELPASPEPRTRSIHLLQQTGIGHVLEFPVVLRGILDKVAASGLYASPTLQTLRLLKRYGLIRRQQLEFKFPASGDHATPHVETAQEVQEEA